MATRISGKDQDRMLRVFYKPKDASKPLPAIATDIHNDLLRDKALVVDAEVIAFAHAQFRTYEDKGPGCSRRLKKERAEFKTGRLAKAAAEAAAAARQDQRRQDAWAAENLRQAMAAAPAPPPPPPPSEDDDGILLLEVDFVFGRVWAAPSLPAVFAVLETQDQLRGLSYCPSAIAACTGAAVPLPRELAAAAAKQRACGSPACMFVRGGVSQTQTQPRAQPQPQPQPIPSFPFSSALMEDDDCGPDHGPDLGRPDYSHPDDAPTFFDWDQLDANPDL